MVIEYDLRNEGNALGGLGGLSVNTRSNNDDVFCMEKLVSPYENPKS